MSALGDRLRARGIDNPGGFIAWCLGVGYRDPLEACSDRDLDARVHEYRLLVGSTRPSPSSMTLEQARRMNAEGAQRHRDRMQLERVARKVIASEARAARSQWETCLRCTPRVPCYRHEGG